MEAGTRIEAGVPGLPREVRLSAPAPESQHLLSSHLVWIAQLLAFRIEDPWVGGFRIPIAKEASSCSAVCVSGAAVASNRTSMGSGIPIANDGTEP